MIFLDLIFKKSSLASLSSPDSTLICYARVVLELDPDFCTELLLRPKDFLRLLLQGVPPCGVPVTLTPKLEPDPTTLSLAFFSDRLY